ncbi:PEP-CTERM system TPR-repeat protein PrsT [Paraglaciecola aquimarina]|uniref:PEP-CTERM system TPR-repeat protein PrsT n=1 Tax=Paraglaciecola aquimarina TaxID=1235557 RepID=A0ABU3T255_9ALTE|nr:XrtA/PEP-CTERM system TPR-repeat protein PrsT [Paraglaciecola aquimarina]MDU0356347.1 PEP-CTERM system TPR-repeat protein PrsT [Paraglaciecola aquimarina]
MSYIKKMSLVIVIAASLSACAKESTSEKLVKADKWLADGNHQAAILVLKSAAQADPKSAEVRFKLGTAYLDTGLAASAEKELNFALKQGYEPNLVMPLIAKSLIQQFKNEEVVELVNNAKGLKLEAMTTLYTIQAQAYFALKDNEAANTAIFNANELSAESPYAKLGQAYGAFNKNEIVVALDTVNQLLEQNPNFTEALLLKGQLETAKGDFATALVNFEKYHSLQPDLFQGKVYLADSYIKNNMLDKAEKHVNGLLSINKNSPFINQLKSHIKYLQENYAEAKSYAENAIAYGGENATTSTIAAVSAYQLGLNEQAYTHLSNSVDLLPEKHQLRGLYQILKVKLGYGSEDGIDQNALLGLKDSNPTILIDTGLALSRKGKLNEAKNFLDIIDSAKIKDPAELTRLSLLKLSLQDDTAFMDLQKIIDKSPGDIDAQSILANVYSAEGNEDKAIAAAQAIIEHHPKKVDGYNLKGLILTEFKKFDEAKLEYQQALDIDPKDISANLFFGKLALKNKDEVKALGIFKRLINFEPIHLPSLITYYALEHKVGVPSDAIKPIQNAYSKNPDNIKYALNYTKLLEVEKQYEDALSILNKIKVSKTLPEPYWTLRVHLHLMQKNEQEVEKALLQWTSTNPESGIAWRYLANLYESRREYSKALSQVKKGKSLAETAIDNLNVLEVQLLLQLKRTSEAQLVLDQLKQSYQADNPVIALLNGQLLLIQKNYEDALPLLIKNYEFKPSTDVLKLILDCHVKLSQKGKAIAFTQKHIELFPKDIAAKLYLAGLAMEENKPLAEEVYKNILETEPLNSIALNNLAAVLQQQGKSDESVTVTKNALSQAPEEPYLLEIYASALLVNNQPNEAISAYAKAYKNSDKSIKYAKFYVAALRKTGNELMANKISQDAGIQ